MIDPANIGKRYPPFTAVVDKGRIRLFAKATGNDDPIYQHEDAARRAGYRSLPALPTYPFTMAMDAGQPFLVLDDLDIDKTKTVHGEQSFTYHRDICAGDVITGQQRIADIFAKKGGALEFIVTEIAMKNQDGDPVCDLRCVTVVRNA